MGGFVPVLPGDDQESDSLNPKVKDSGNKDRNFVANFADFEISEVFPDFSAVEEWFDNLSPGSLDFWSNMGGDCELDLDGSGVSVKVEESEGEKIGSLCGGGAVSVKVEESEGEKIGSLCGGAVSVKLKESGGENALCVGVGVMVKVEQCELGDVNDIVGEIGGGGEGVNDVESFVEREMGRVSLGARNDKLGCGGVEGIVGESETVRMSFGTGNGGLNVIDGEGVSVRPELDVGDCAVCDRAVVMGGGVCVKTDLASNDGEISDDLMVIGVVQSDKNLDDGQQACEDVQGKDTKDADEEIDEMEEGEIREAGEQAIPAEKDVTESEEHVDDADKMVDWSAFENGTNGFDGVSDDENEVIVGPILSKNELKVLPPVPSVSVKLEPHHEMVAIGPVLSIIELQVVVEGCLKHNPLSEGSILWIAESRSPLGFVDEIFGPVKNPYYLIRYNTKVEIPAGVKEGILVSSVPEYASYVLNQKDLCKKGYDLSGKNDEEVSEEEEFSDDEKEAEYKRMQRMYKRDSETNVEKTVNRKAGKKKDNGRNPNWKPRSSTQLVPTTQSQVQLNGNRDHPPSGAAPTDIGNSASSPAIPPGFFGGNNGVPPFPLQMPSGSNFASPFNPSLLSGLPLQGPGAVLLNAISNALLLPANNGQFSAQPVVLPNQVPFQMGYNTNQNNMANLVPPCVQLNPFGDPASASWRGPIPQNSFNPAGVGMSLGGQLDPNNLLLFANALGIHLSRGQNDQTFNAMAPPPAVIPPTAAMPPPMQSFRQFNLGASSGPGHRPFRRGGGRFSGGRGRGRFN